MRFELSKTIAQVVQWFLTGRIFKMGELVECHSGFTYADKPVALRWENRRLEITGITTHWRSPQGRHFRVRTSNGQEFELSYREADNEWQIKEL
jgi:hypothetical protein